MTTQGPDSSCGALINPVGPLFVLWDPASFCGVLVCPVGPWSVLWGPDPSHGALIRPMGLRLVLWDLGSSREALVRPCCILLLSLYQYHGHSLYTRRSLESTVFLDRYQPTHQLVTAPGVESPPSGSNAAAQPTRLGRGPRSAGRCGWLDPPRPARRTAPQQGPAPSNGALIHPVGSWFVLQGPDPSCGP